MMECRRGLSKDGPGGKVIKEIIGIAAKGPVSFDFRGSPCSEILEAPRRG
jgi:hypothetical protein